MTDDGKSMSLQDLVLTRLREMGAPGPPVSAREAARRSRGLVSNDTLSKIARGRHSGRLDDRTVQGLAAALQVQPAKVYDAAGIPRSLARWLPPERLDRLNVAQRQLLEEIGGALLDADRRGYERGLRDARGSDLRSGGV